MIWYGICFLFSHIPRVENPHFRYGSYCCCCYSFDYIKVKGKQTTSFFFMNWHFCHQMHAYMRKIDFRNVSNVGIREKNQPKLWNPLIKISLHHHQSVCVGVMCVAQGRQANMKCRIENIKTNFIWKHICCFKRFLSSLW